LINLSFGYLLEEAKRFLKIEHHYPQENKLNPMGDINLKHVYLPRKFKKIEVK